jgi:hypothetical protein
MCRRSGLPMLGDDDSSPPAPRPAACPRRSTAALGSEIDQRGPSTCVRGVGTSSAHQRHTALTGERLENVLELRLIARGQPDEPEEADVGSAEASAPGGGEVSPRPVPSDLWICTGCERVMDATGRPADPYQRQFVRLILRFGRCAECSARP